VGQIEVPADPAPNTHQSSNIIKQPTVMVKCLIKHDVKHDPKHDLKHIFHDFLHIPWCQIELQRALEEVEAVAAPDKAMEQIW
jgi:hypothetical protein